MYAIRSYYAADGKMNQVEEYSYLPLQFFISNGNYKPGDGEKLINGNFIPDVVNELYGKKK